MPSYKIQDDEMKDEELVLKFKTSTITFYPLTVKHIRNHPEEMKALMQRGESPFAPERFAKLLKLYTLSAQRGDASVTEEMVESLVDISDLARINRVILGSHPDEVIERTAKVEVVAERPTNTLTGSESSAG
jgi:hypothetical protein